MRSPFWFIIQLTRGSNLGRPLAFWIATLHDLDLRFHGHERVAEPWVGPVFYNLFVALLRFWRNEENTPYPIGTITIQVPKYKYLQTRIVGGPSESVVLTPDLAGALVFRVLQKYTTSQPPAYLDAALLTRSPQANVIGTVRTTLVTNPSDPPTFSADALATNVSSTTLADLEGVSYNSSQGSSLSVGYGVGYHIQFHGLIPAGRYSSAREAWLNHFLSWITELVLTKQANAFVPIGAHSEIRRAAFDLEDGRETVFLATTGAALATLTYNEFLGGMENLLVRVVQGAFALMDASFLKNGQEVAVFRVLVTPTAVKGDRNAALMS